jgi:hypothetical protein
MAKELKGVEVVKEFKRGTTFQYDPIACTLRPSSSEDADGSVTYIELLPATDQHVPAEPPSEVQDLSDILIALADICIKHLDEETIDTIKTHLKNQGSNTTAKRVLVVFDVAEKDNEGD